ncbi:MORC family CW-type zinc finger protein 3-like isoform X2 [Liolophura sinensis]
MINGQVTLVFVDNGNGMNPDRLHKMLSFGFSDKQEIRGHRPIGQYGNGFKSGSMRLGKDVLVFTRQRGTMSVGFLSQSYLQAINAKTVFVPIATWRLPSKQMVQTQECYSSLKEILRHSIFRTERSIIQELDALGCIGHSGTEIIIYNLKRDRRGNLELDFESDPNDILNPQTLEVDRSMMFRPVAEPSPAFRRSLREYCSILYLKPRMKIMLRGEKVKTKLVSKSLSRTEKDVYKPHFLPRPVKIIFGFSPSKVEDYGILMYHRNRLIIAYEKVGYQKQANELGVGVVGVVELNFLEPIHNKQDFNKTTQYNSCINALGVKLNEYWNEKMKGITAGNRLMGPGSRPPDWLWAQCDKCLKWRRMPPTIREGELPKKWFCHMNLDATHNRCDIPEEAEDDEDMLMRPSYEKTYKKQMEERKRLNRLEQLRELQKREKQLQMKEEELKRMRMNMSNAANPAQPTLPNPPATMATTSNSAEPIDVKPDEADLLRAQRELTEAKRRETQQTQLIEQLQQQKDLLEKKQRDVLKIAESITIKQIQDTEASNGPNQTLEFGGTGQKRPLDSEEDSSNKRVRVVTSDGEVMYVVQGDDTPKPLIDLTLSDDEAEPAKAAEESGQQKDTETGAGQSDSLSGEAPQEGSAQLTTLAEEERDIKPDLDELDRRILEAQRAMGMVDDPEAAKSSESAQAEGETQGMDTPSATDGEDNNTQAAEDSNPTATESLTEAGDSNAEPKVGEAGGGSGEESEQCVKAAGTDGEGDEAMDTGASEGTEDAEGNAKTANTETLSEAGKESAAGSAAGQLDDVGDDDFGGDFPEDDEGDEFLRDSETPNDPERASSRTSKESREGKGQEGDMEDQKSNGNEDYCQNKDDNGSEEKTSEQLKEEDDDKKSNVPESDAKDMKSEEKTDSIKDEKLNVKSLTNGEAAGGKGPHFENKPKLSKIVKTRGVQTLPVEIKGMLTDSYNFSKLAPSEIHHLLVQRTNELEGLRKNVRELLRIILPEVDLGTPDSIDLVVQEVIQVNQTEAASSGPPK